MDSAFEHLVDLAVARNGAVVLEASDDFFAPKERLILSEEPVFKRGVFTEHGKWMDGWESRRRRIPGNDWCTIRLGFRGRIRGVDIDTRHFVGNFPPEASLDVADVPLDDDTPLQWAPLLPRITLEPDAHNLFPVETSTCCTHVRLNIFPDGGVARLRVYGEVEPDWSTLTPYDAVELTGLQFGGFPVACNDEHFGRMMNLLRSDQPVDMGDGWETRRRRIPGHDWCVIRLGTTGVIERIQVDTTHFKGNFPDRCSVEGCRCPEGMDPTPDTQWTVVIPESKLHADKVHDFGGLGRTGPFTHLRLNIFPDGGIARFRGFGRIIFT